LKLRIRRSRQVRVIIGDDFKATTDQQETSRQMDRHIRMMRSALLPGIQPYLSEQFGSGHTGNLEAKGEPFQPMRVWSEVIG
jgi:hypothetical protein